MRVLVERLGLHSFPTLPFPLIVPLAPELPTSTTFHFSAEAPCAILPWIVPQGYVGSLHCLLIDSNQVEQIPIRESKAG
jgi:hypothetical protein